MPTSPQHQPIARLNRSSDGECIENMEIGFCQMLRSLPSESENLETTAGSGLAIHLTKHCLPRG